MISPKETLTYPENSNRDVRVREDCMPKQLVYLPRSKHQPEKSQILGVFTDTSKVHTTISRQDESGHVLELHEYFITPLYLP